MLNCPFSCLSFRRISHVPDIELLHLFNHISICMPIAIWLSGKSIHSYSGSVNFESRLGYLLSWRSPWFSSAHLSRWLYRNSVKPRSLPSKPFQFIIHVLLPFRATWPRYQPCRKIGHKRTRSYLRAWRFVKCRQTKRLPYIDGPRKYI